jgi:hypothetical protein
VLPDSELQRLSASNTAAPAPAPPAPAPPPPSPSSAAASPLPTPKQIAAALSDAAGHIRALTAALAEEKRANAELRAQLAGGGGGGSAGGG